MELLTVITHTEGGENYVKNLFSYLCDKRMILGQPYGVNSNKPEYIAEDFELVAKLFGNGNKNKVIHIIVSLSREVAPDARSALYTLKKVMEPFISEHLVLIVIHNKEREDSAYHGHIAISPTNYMDGTMLHANNRFNFSLGQRIADCTGEECRLMLRYKNDETHEFHKVFKPHMDSDQ